MKYRKILFVCTGNTCRSPMAEIALKAELKRRKIKWYLVRSAGLSVEKGSALSPQSGVALREKGLPVSAYTSRQLTERMLKEAEHVICMTEAQARRLSAYENVTSMYALTGREIPDPYGRGMEVYRETLNAIIAGLPALIDRLDLKNFPQEEGSEGEKI